MSASDPTITQIEADLRESQFATWDVERFLAGRHQAKIDALTAPTGGQWKRWWRVAKEVGTASLACIGLLKVVTASGVWLLTGEFHLLP